MLCKTDALGVSISKAHKSGSGFLPGRLTRGRPGRSKTSASAGMALKGAMSTPTALTLQKKVDGGKRKQVTGSKTNVGFTIACAHARGS